MSSNDMVINVVHETVSYAHAMAYAWKYDISINDILLNYATVVHDQRLAHQAFVFDMIWPWLMYIVEPERWIGTTAEERKQAFESGIWWVPGKDEICDQTGQPWDILGGEPVPPNANDVLQALELFFRSEWMQSLMLPEECIRMARTLLLFGPHWLQEGETYESMKDTLIKPTIYRPLSSYAARLQKTNTIRARQANTLEIMRERGYNGLARQQYEEMAASGAFAPLPPPSFKAIREARENHDVLNRIVYDPNIVAKLRLVPFMRDGLSGAASSYTITAHRLDTDVYVFRVVIPDPVLREQFLATLGLKDESTLDIQDPFAERWLAAYRSYRNGDIDTCRAILREITAYVESGYTPHTDR